MKVEHSVYLAAETDKDLIDMLIDMSEKVPSASVKIQGRPWSGSGHEWEVILIVDKSEDSLLGEWYCEDGEGFAAGQYDA